MNFTTQGVRLDRVRGGRQKYKRRPEVDPLPFPGPFPAGPLAVAGGPRKTGEDPGFLSFGGRGQLLQVCLVSSLALRPRSYFSYFSLRGNSKISPQTEVVAHRVPASLGLSIAPHIVPAFRRQTRVRSSKP